ncbi:nucleotidyltransferase [Ammoniphilus sp. CFH 90114]|uniref:nucleotidyltransferase n=1 Tax=Ammoniphilus sp. CFH 90114 TaxID=2493665 RepID=UPI00100E0CC3|nr:nucleotidyltransferase [Ammoniphilus sp. CFH 90114]RXT15071.1 nucleotidyltransferase [Ammoniphilus sp. CFH 90114]
MKVVGLIVEYNPLHNGHLYHYQQSLRVTGADATVAVMSGNFLQRGEPAIVSKWARTEMALSIGIDLVLELPAAYCTQNAEMFAFGAVSTLHALGIVQNVCFGSESGNLEWIEHLAQQLIHEPDAFTSKIRASLDEGMSYPSAYAKAASSLVAIPEEWLAQPNNILGLNYVLALKRLASPIRPATITRQKAGYHQSYITDAQIASATALRKLIAEENLEKIRPYVPESTFSILEREKIEQRFPMNWDRFFPFLIHSLTVKSTQDLSLIHEMEEGLEHRIKRVYSKAYQFQELMEALKTKRYTWNRLQRLLFYTLINLHKQEMNSLQVKRGVPYIRVLGFSEKGQKLLQLVKKKGAIPIISKIGGNSIPMLDLDIRASSVYNLGYPCRQAGEVSEFARPPVIW